MFESVVYRWLRTKRLVKSAFHSFVFAIYVRINWLKARILSFKLFWVELATGPSILIESLIERRRIYAMLKQCPPAEGYVRVQFYASVKNITLGKEPDFWDDLPLEGWSPTHKIGTLCVKTLKENWGLDTCVVFDTLRKETVDVDDRLSELSVHLLSRGERYNYRYIPFLEPSTCLATRIKRYLRTKYAKQKFLMSVICHLIFKGGVTQRTFPVPFSSSFWQVYNTIKRHRQFIIEDWKEYLLMWFISLVLKPLDFVLYLVLRLVLFVPYTIIFALLKWVLNPLASKIGRILSDVWRPMRRHMLRVFSELLLTVECLGLILCSPHFWIGATFFGYLMLADAVANKSVTIG